MKVLIADDHQILLDSLSLLISTIDGVEVVGTINDSRSVVLYLENEEIDLLITDFNMPHLSGVDLTLLLREKYPDLKILMLTVSEDVEIIKQAFMAGISGYVMKKANRTELESAIRAVSKGEKYYSDSVMKQLLCPIPPAKNGSEVIPTTSMILTSRELEVIRLIAQELSTPEIAHQLFISVGTVETHRHNILRKLNVKNVIGIVKYALHHKLI